MANLTFKQLQDTFTELTFKIKGLDYNSTDQNVQKLVRRAYEQESQPFNNITDDTTYVWFTIKDDPTNELFVETNELVPVYQDDIIVDYKLRQGRAQARVIEVTFTFYGDVAFDSSQTARIRLTKDEIYRFLKPYGIYLNREIGAVAFTYEEFQNRWWKRADFSAMFHLSMADSEDIETLLQVDIDVLTKNSTQSIIIKED